MSWSSAEQFFAMGGYAFYVWGSYAVAVICVGAELWRLRSRLRTLSRRVGHNAEPSPGMHETET